MRYQKPQIGLLAEAATAIQGSKSSAPIQDNTDPFNPTYTHLAYEADE